MISPSRQPGSGYELTLLLILSFLAGVLLSSPFGALATTGWAGLAFLSLLGYLIGLAGVGPSGVIFGIGVLFGNHRWPTVLLFWILPLVAGFLVHIEVKRRQLASFRSPLTVRAWRYFVTLVSSYRSPFTVRAWRYFGLIVGFAPTVAAAAVSARGPAMPLSLS